jgi:GNAT superfamily N-acetyltransferase
MSKFHKKTLHLSLTDQNSSKYGFARFCYPNEMVKSGDPLKRKILLAIGGKHRETWANITIDPGKLVSLRSDIDQRLIDWPEFRIKTVRGNIEPMKFLSERVGWNQTLEDLSQYVKMDPEGSFLAGYETGQQFIPLGSGAVFPIGTDLSWISMILVHPEVRRQGIASALMRQCLIHARLTSRNPVVGLDATPEGKQVYDNLGFSDTYKLWRCKVRRVNMNLRTTPALLLEPIKHIEDIASFITECGYLNRLPALKVLHRLPSAACYLARTDNKVLGIVLSRPGRRYPSVGPLLATNKEVAGILLSETVNHWAAKGFNNVFIDIPENRLHVTREIKKPGEIPGSMLAESFLHGCEVTLVRPFIRMYQLLAQTTEALPGLEDQKNIESSRILNRMMEKSKACYIKTAEFIEKENELTIPNLYAIGGPEIG